jgi:hypothetical protein
VAGKERNEGCGGMKENMRGIKEVMDGGGRVQVSFSGYGEKGERWLRKSRNNITIK